MVARKKGLGRGLDALLGGARPAADREPVPIATDAAQASPAGDVVSGERYVQMPVEQLRRGRYQPRRAMDPERLEELAASIRSQGVMQPIVARALPHQTGQPGDAANYEIIAGERRWRAAQLAGLERVPVIVREVADEAAIALALIENIQREELTPVEEAVALQRLIDEFDMTQQAVADTIGKSRTTVTNMLRLLKLGGEVRELLDRGDLEMGHARALLTLSPEQQLVIAREVVRKGLSVRQTEALARRAADGKPVTEAPATRTDPDTAALERRLSDQMGAPVSIRHSARGSGQLVIRYTNLDELDGILAHIK